MFYLAAHGPVMLYDEPRVFSLCLQADMACKASDAEEGLRLVGQALAVLNAKRVPWGGPAAHHLKGELLLAAGRGEAEAEGCFRRAICIAREQQAKSWELPFPFPATRSVRVAIGPKPLDAAAKACRM